MLFSSKLRFFEPPIAFVATQKAWVDLTPKKHRKRKKHRKEDQGKERKERKNIPKSNEFLEKRISKEIQKSKEKNIGVSAPKACDFCDCDCEFPSQAGNRFPERS